MAISKRTRFEADGFPSRFRLLCLLPIASVPIRRKAPVQNEPTAKLINACGKWSYENARPTGKPPKAKLPWVMPDLRPVARSPLGSIGNWKLEIGNPPSFAIQHSAFSIFQVPHRDTT